MQKVLWVICSIWEIIYKNMISAHYLQGSEPRLIRVAYRKYKGKERELKGEVIKKGDLVAELHLSNLALNRYKDCQSPEWALYKDFILELRLLSKIIQAEQKPIKALTAITLLAPVATRLGFSVIEIPPGPWSSLNYIWLRFLRRAFSPQQNGGLKSLDAKRKPVEIWMPVQRFTGRF